MKYSQLIKRLNDLHQEGMDEDIVLILEPFIDKRGNKFCKPIYCKDASTDGEGNIYLGYDKEDLRRMQENFDKGK